VAAVDDRRTMKSASGESCPRFLFFRDGFSGDGLR
jgi:hypothetical protein